MDNLPNDPSKPPFGSSFNPLSNPPVSIPNIPASPAQRGEPNPPNHPSTYLSERKASSAYSEVAQEKPRDSHGRFASDHLSNNYDPQTTPTPPNTPNIFKKAFDFLIQIKWKKMTLYITGAATFIYLIVNNPTFQNMVNHFFPNSSPILGRAISYQGVLKSSQSGIYSLVLPDQQTYTIHFKPSAALTNLKKLNEVVVKGNLTWTPYVIENAEIYPLNLSAEDSSQNTTNPAPNGAGPTPPNSLNSPNPSASSNPSSLPPLFSNLTWEITQTKTLTFTSGKRRIEEQGVYLESSQVTAIPQDFINYYTNQLTNLGFKQTFNSTDPNGTTITYSKDDSFFTFGTKNVYSGSGENKKVTGYKAFIEHN